MIIMKLVAPCLNPYTGSSLQGLATPRPLPRGSWWPRGPSTTGHKMLASSPGQQRKHSTPPPKQAFHQVTHAARSQRPPHPQPRTGGFQWG